MQVRFADPRGVLDALEPSIIERIVPSRAALTSASFEPKSSLTAAMFAPAAAATSRIVSRDNLCCSICDGRLHEPCARLVGWRRGCTGRHVQSSSTSLRLKSTFQANV